jgi:Flp pilus assembly protein TadD
MNKISFIITLLCLTGCVNTHEAKVLPPEFNDQEAKKAESEKNYLRACEEYRTIYQNHKSTTVALKLADNCRKAGNYEEAGIIYSKLLDVDDNNSTQDLYIMEGLGLCKMHQEQYNEAIKIFISIFTEDASRWRSINALGTIYAIIGDYHESQKYFNIALNLGQKKHIIYNNMALTSAFLGKYYEAISYQKQALSLVDNNSPEKERIECNLALLYGITGEFKLAYDILSRYLLEEQIERNMEFYKTLYNNRHKAKKHMKDSMVGG